MKKFSLISLATLLNLTICFSQTLPFRRYSNWDDMLLEAKTDKKQIFLYFGAHWCAPCKQLIRGVFADSITKRFLQSNFHCYHLDMDSSNAIPLLTKYGIAGVPAIVVLNEHGFLKETPHNIPQDAGEFNKLFKKIAETRSIHTMVSNRIDLDYPEFYVDFFTSRFSKLPDSLALNNYLLKQSDLFSEINWNILCLLNTNDRFYDFVVSNKQKFQEYYGEGVAFKIYFMFSHLAKKYINQKDSISYNKLIGRYLKNPSAPDYIESLKSFYLREIRFLGKTEMDWGKFIKRSKAYIDQFGDNENHFICNYAYDADHAPDSVNQFLLQIMKPVLIRMPYANIFFEYGVLLLKTKNFKEAVDYFTKVVNAATDAQKAYYENAIRLKKERFHP